MLDVKRIRNDFDALSEKLATRGVVAETLNELKELDVKRRELLIKSEELKAQRNIASDDIAQAKRNKEDASEQIAAMQKVSAEIKEIDAFIKRVNDSHIKFRTKDFHRETWKSSPSSDIEKSNSLIFNMSLENRS